MVQLTWLEPLTPLPDPQEALPEGLLAAGGDLSLARLTEAYRHGIFPWFNEGDPILWWSPDPRMVLTCSELRISRSLAKRLRQIERAEDAHDARIQVSTDLAFDAVMQACAEPRRKQKGTWISPHIRLAYGAWHRAGVVHSVETWIDGRLAGGLYGVSMGRFFFGESMFSRESDASKIALVYLVRFLMKHGIQHIDCQQETEHLGSLGARPWPRDDFLKVLQEALALPAPDWKPGLLRADGSLAPITAERS